MRHTLWLTLAWMVAGGAWADDSEKPGRGVARISVINGDVSVRRGDSGDLVAAAINAPLVVQDRVLTGPASRAELQFDYANMLRIGSSSEVRLTELEYRRYQVQVAHGTVTFRVLRNSEAEVEVSTPAASVRPFKKGAYRITVRDDGQTEITVRSGEVEIYTPRGVERLHSGKTMLVRGTPSDPEFQVVRAIEYDQWDRWNDGRDRDLDRSNAYRYISRDIYGAEDLDYHGRWVYAPPYGWVWSPRVVVGWAPYRYGRWVWEDWYGWTWLSYDPWGWAPYHYGRWFWGAPYGWCWYPGGFYHRHYWSPALVAFFGFGSYSGFHVGVGFGNIGWVPLAPYEPYYPWYGSGYYGGYRHTTVIDRSVNIVNNVNVTNVYRNARVQNGITAVDSGDFTRGRIINTVRASDGQLRQASLMKGQLPVVPATESLRLSDREARPATLGRGMREDRFFVHRQPAQVERISFEEQRKALERSGPVAARSETSPITRQATDSQKLESFDGGRSWRRFGEPGRRESGVTSSPPQMRANEGRVEGEGGWRRFGQSIPAGRETGSPRSLDRGEGRGGDASWRHFGEPGSVRSERGGESYDNWRRSGSPRESRSQDLGWRGGDQTERRESAPRWERRSESPRFDRGEMRRERGGESIQIAPPIVRERGDRGGGGIPRGMDQMRGEGGGARVSRGEAGGSVSRGEGGSWRSEGGGGRARGR